MNGFFSRLILLLAVLCLCAGGAMLYQDSLVEQSNEDLSARLIQAAKKPATWKVFEEQHVQSGATIPADTNVVFHLPLDMQPTPEEVILGQESNKVRYWGYCFEENFNEETVAARVNRGQLPGLLFLSVAERKERQRIADAKRTQISIFNPPKTQEELLEATTPAPREEIRHQLDIFKPGMICYIMTSDALAIAVDSDRDLLNNKLERELDTKVDNPDTDEDGVGDGIEFLNGMLPTIRDSDGDGIIDGIEDKNWNGKVDRGETIPTSRDSDKDSLCDGSCQLKVPGSKTVYIGEDNNLNGQVDSGESDPLKWSTRGDGISDYQAYVNCKLGQQSYCVR